MRCGELLRAGAWKFYFLIVSALCLGCNIGGDYPNGREVQSKELVGVWQITPEGIDALRAVGASTVLIGVQLLVAGS